MRKEILLLLLLCGWYCHAHAQYEHLLHKPFAERSVLIDSIHPSWNLSFGLDSSIHYYSAINAFARTQGDKQLALQSELLLKVTRLESTYRKNRPGYEKQKEDLFRQLSSVKKREKYLYPYILMTLARMYEVRDSHNDAFELKLKAYEVYSEYNIEEFPYLAEHTGSLGSSYYKFKDYYSSAKCMKRVTEYKLYDNNYFSSLNTYALCYRNLRKWDTAELYFNTLQKEAVKHDNIEWQLIAKLNLGHTYRRWGKTDKAYLYLTDAKNIAKTNGKDYGIVEASATLARIAFDSGQYAKAKAIALEGTMVHGITDWIFHYHIDAQRLYQVLADVYEQERNYKKAFLYMDSLLMVVDTTSINRQLNLSNAIQAKTELLTDKYNREKANARLADAKQKQIRYLAILGIAVTLFISFLLINRQVIKRKQIEAEKKAAESKLLASKKELHAFTQHLQEKNKLIEQFTNELENYKTAADEQTRQETIHHLEQATILTDDDWIKFRHMFEEVHAGFLDRLKEKVPDLTPGEIRFMVLSKLDLSTKEMAGILGIGTSTVRKYRHQVRNKLGLPEDGSIEEVVELI